MQPAPAIPNFNNTDSSPQGHDFNAASVLLGLSIVNKVKLRLKKPLNEVNLTMNQWVVLKMLYLKCASTPGNLAKTIEADPTTISRHLDSLENKGLISRENDTEDRRVVHLQITQNGISIAEQIYQHYPNILQSLSRDISQEQQKIWKNIEQLLFNNE